MKSLPIATMLIAGATLIMSSCRSNSPKPSAVDTVPVIDSVANFLPDYMKESNYMPKAVIYRTSGDYIDNVPITLSANGKEVVSYPAPTDLTDQSTPVPLIDGWLLDRRGVSKNSVFTDYTYAQYRQLKQAPTPEELLKHVIEGARVTATVNINMTTTEAEADTAAVDSIIRTSIVVKLHDAPTQSL